jgi:eukaryotic-like serine/threonine-protein kinase
MDEAKGRGPDDLTVAAVLESEPPPPEPERSAPPPLSFRAGAILCGKYRIDRVVAEGGLGIVLAATHLQLGQRVAIKYLKPSAAAQKPVVERFIREARLASQIKSDHVVRVHDVGALDDGGPYIVMEYLEGVDLGRVLDAGPLPVRTAIDYVLQACDALAEAHATGIVHRDLKPGNLFLARRAAGSSIVKIIDFGISKMAPSRSPSGTWEHVTTAGEIFGTPVYMSPEQLRSATNVDARADVWALGVVLHELLTGTMPFSGATVPQLCTSILNDAPVRLTNARPDASRELEAVILKCLEKDRSHRYRNVAELAQELAPFAPETASARVEHIKRVIVEGGSSVRPPAPSRASLDLMAVAQGSAPPVVMNKPRSARAMILATAASMAVAAAVGLALIMASRGSGSTRGTASASAATVVMPTVAVASPSGEPAPTTPPATPDVATAVTSATAPTVVHPPPRRAQPPPSSATRRNADFGERQ